MRAFAKSVVLMLCVNLFVFSAMAAPPPARDFGYGSQPARASSSRSRPKAVSVNSFHQENFPDAGLNAITGTSYYGAPFRDDYAYHNDGLSPSVQAAFDKWWKQYQIDWAYAFPGCSYVPTYDSAGPQTGHFAHFSLQGTCGGGGNIYGTAYAFDPGKNAGNGAGCDGGEGSDDGGGGSGAGGSGDSSGSSCADNKGAPMAGDPINTSTGNKYLQDDDYPGAGWLTFRRFYNSSAAVASSAMGSHWRHTFARSLEILGAPATSIVMFRPDGKQEIFTKASGMWTTAPDIPDVMVEDDDGQGNITGYTVFIAALRHFETYGIDGLLQSVTDEAGQGIALTYSTTLTNPSIAPRAGLLLTVTDLHGRQLNFTYDSGSRVHQVTLPDAGTLIYAYDTNGNLLSVQYPDGHSRQYVYNESTLTGGTNLPNAMTGIIDASGTRYESTTFDSSGRATSSVFAGSVGNTQVTYNSDGTSTVQYPLGTSATMGFATVNGLVRVASLDQPCGTDCDQPWQTRTYDANGYPASYTDFNGNITTTTYDSEGLLTQKVEASGTNSQRTTNFTWDTTLRVPLSHTVLDASGHAVSKTQWVNNTRGQPLARCEIDPSNSAATGYTCAATGTVVPAGVRRWTYTYCDAVDSTQCPLVGLRLSTTGPRTDLTQTTTYTYYLNAIATGCGTPGGACHQPGDLHTVTDALGHVTTIVSYDAAGRITRETDPNGVATDLTYTPRGWLASRTVGGATTTFTYTLYGAVASVTDPDGIATTYTYDAAHRLIDIIDAEGNRLHYTLDVAGNKIAEQVYDVGATVRRSLTRTYNSLGELTSAVDGLNQTVFSANYSDSYDDDGNLVHSADGRGVQQQRGYDALNRLVQTIQDYDGTAPATGDTATAVSYDALDRLTGVTDPSGLVTGYTYDGLSNATGQTSPDTGTTTRTYDAAGNVLTSTDANGITATNSYDALDRLVGTTYPDSTQDVAYHHDESDTVTGCTASYPVGRLTRIVENTITTVYCYDAQGRVTRKQQVTASSTDTTGYAYTLAGRLDGITYPDGSTASYIRDTDGHIQSVSATPSGGSATTVVSAVTYLPFGPVSGYTLGNGQAIARAYDANYRLTDLTSPAFNLHVARDAMGNITAIGNSPGASPATETYSYDALNRLMDVTEADSSTLENVTYGQAGDRLSKSGSGLATGMYGYNPGTHQLIATGNQARTVDANGNTTSLSQAGITDSLSYNDRNRLTTVQEDTTTVGVYTYNAHGQRIQKVTGTSTVRFNYNQTGQLLAEAGTTSRNYVWLDSLPVATLDTQSGSSSIHYITADQLDTPRAISDTSGVTVWSWPYAGNAWGEAAPASSGYVFNLRFPGQYHDTESGLNYNVNRHYEPAIGRYDQPDPMGLAAGLNLYAYVGSNPLSYTDPLGLEWQASIGLSGTIGFLGFAGGGINVGITSNGNITVQLEGHLEAGPGIYAGLGATGGVSHTKCDSVEGFSTDSQWVAEGNIGYGPSIGGSGTYNGSTNIGGSTGIGKYGVGAGVMVAGGRSGTVTWTSPSVIPVLKSLLGGSN